MRRNASISPNPTSVSTPEIDGPDQQLKLHVGPTGVVYKGGGTAPWAKRCALTKTPSATSKLLFMVLASFVHGPDEAAWPSQSTLAEMTGLTARSIRNATKQLEAAGRMRVERMGGDKGIRYWLLAGPDVTRNRVEGERGSPLRGNEVPVEAERGSPEVPKEGTKEKKAAALPVPDQEGNDDGKPKADRHTCPCGNTWPKLYGPVCFQCNTPVRSGGRLLREYGRRYASSHPGSGAAPTPGKYDSLFPSDVGGLAPEPGKYDFLEDEIEEDAPAGNTPIGVLTPAEAPEEAPVAKRPWAEQKRAWKFQRVDGSWC